MTGAFQEGGLFGVFILLIWAGIPLWFVWKLAQEWRDTVQTLRKEPVQFFSMVMMLAGMIGWFSWLITDGEIGSGLWSSAGTIAGLIIWNLSRTAA